MAVEWPYLEKMTDTLPRAVMRTICKSAMRLDVPWLRSGNALKRWQKLCLQQLPEQSTSQHLDGKLYTDESTCTMAWKEYCAKYWEKEHKEKWTDALASIV